MGARSAGPTPGALRIATSTSRLRRLPGARAAALAVAYLALWLVLARVASVFQIGGGISLWYPPTGLTLALLLVFGLRYAVLLPLTDVLAKLLGITPDAAWVDVLARAAWTTLVYVGCVAFLLVRVRLDPRLPTWRDVSWFVGIGCVAGPLLVAAGQVVQYDMSGLRAWSALPTDVAGFWAGSANGIGVLTPALLVAARRFPALFRSRPALPARPPAGSPGRLETSGQVVLLVATVLLAYGGRVEQSLDFTYLVYVPITWAAVRGGFARAVGAALLTNVLAVALVGDTIADRPLRLQFGLVTFTLAALLLGALVTDRQADATTAAQAAMRDPLTGLFNRGVLLDRLTAAVHRAYRRPDPLCAVFFCDLDGFKSVNDGLGHDVGDRLLVAVADRIQATVRPTDTVARLGGDEIAVLLDDIPDAEEAVGVADRLVEVLARPYVDGDREVDITVSIGIAVLGTERSAATERVGISRSAAILRAEELLRAADAALQQAKHRGGNRREVFNEPLRAQAHQRLHRRAALRRALTDHEIEVVYQPIVGLPDRRLGAVEALARWSHPAGAPVPPVDFIAIAEETGLIHELGLQVLDRACADLAGWRRTGAADLRVAVNVSFRQLLADGFPGQVLATLARHDLPPAALELEITESSAMDQAGPTRTALRRLRAAGVGLVVDDFGTGYSSFSVLRDIAPSTVKIDRSFVAPLPADPATTALVQAMVSMATHLGLEVVAEGVETAEQLRVVTAMGCARAQGFLLGRPMPAGAVADVLPAAGRPGR